MCAEWRERMACRRVDGKTQNVKGVVHVKETNNWLSEHFDSVWQRTFAMELRAAVVFIFFLFIFDSTAFRPASIWVRQMRRRRNYYLFQTLQMSSSFLCKLLQYPLSIFITFLSFGVRISIKQIIYTLLFELRSYPDILPCTSQPLTS